MYRRTTLHRSPRPLAVPTRGAVAVPIDWHHQRNRFGLLALWLLALLFVFWTAIPAVVQAAPRYVEVPVDPDLVGRENSKTLNDLKKVKTNVLRGKESFSANQKDFDRWYRKYVFPAMTRQDHFEELADWRIDITRDLGNARDETARKYLLSIAEKSSDAIMGGNFHPAVRYNAALLLGDLNDREAAVSGRQKTPPIPKASALRKLLAVVGSDTMPDAVKVAAILGITRHANLRSGTTSEAPLSPAEMAQLLETMSAVLTQTELPKTRSLEAHTWIRSLATKALAATGQVGDKGAIFEKLMAIMKSDEEPVELRCEVAAALGRLPIATAKPPVGELIKQMGVTLTKACEEEVNFLDEMFLNPGGRGQMNTYVPSTNRPNRPSDNLDPNAEVEPFFLDEQTVPVRQRLMNAIDCIRTGLGEEGSEKGVVSVVSAREDQTSLDYLRETMDALAEKLADTETTMQDLHSQLYDTNEDLQVAYMGAKAARRGPLAFEPEEPAEDAPAADKEEPVPDFGGF